MCFMFNMGTNRCGSAVKERGSRKWREDFSAAAIVKQKKANGDSYITGQRHLTRTRQEDQNSRGH